jgi:hypothetical protein
MLDNDTSCRTHGYADTHHEEAQLERALHQQWPRSNCTPAGECWTGSLQVNLAASREEEGWGEIDLSAGSSVNAALKIDEDPRAWRLNIYPVRGSHGRCNQRPRIYQVREVYRCARRS